MNVLKTKRGHIKGCITRTLAFSETINEATSLSMLQIRFQKLSESWSEFIQLQDKLYEFADDQEFVDPEPEFAEYESKYFQAHSVLDSAIRKQTVSDSSNQSVDEKLALQQASFLKVLEASKAPKAVQLPKISIPIFSGDYKDWPGFKDLFTGTIDGNPSITATQKFQYLISFLGGDAANLIKHITCSEDNYIEAWDKLESRYDKPHLIIQSFVQIFLSLPSTTSSNIHMLRRLTDGADEVIRGLKALRANSRDPWMIYILLQKLDDETKLAWAEIVGSRADCSINEFIDFLQVRCSCLESTYAMNRSAKTSNKNQNSIRAHVVETKTACPKCKQDHLLPYCKAFNALSVDERRDLVKDKSLCFNCLRHGHTSNKCRSNYCCRTCNSRHHSLVHPTVQTQNQSTSGVNLNQSQSHISNSTLSNQYQSSPLSSPHCSTNPPVINNHSLESTHRASTLLPTALVKARDKQGLYQKIRVLLDTGSQVSFITERAVQRLGLHRKLSRIPVIGIASTSAGVTNGLVTLNLCSLHSANSLQIDCHVVSKLTSLLPSFSVSNFKFKSLLSLELADPNFAEPGPIDVLIGADKVFNIISGPATPSAQGVPCSIQTIFGWVIAGIMQHVALSDDTSAVRTFCTQLDHSQVFDLERFWRLEEVHTEPFLSVEEQRAEEHFASTFSRHIDGRYMVELPFKQNSNLNFGDSLNIALNRLKSLERKFLSNPELKNQYTRFINEYIDLGHMEKVPENEINMDFNACYYLPHHAVFKNDSTSTKVRVVFDGSAKSHSNSSSLNEELLVGPTIQRDIFSICLRSRRHRYTISGDIEKMYRQIWISPKHTNFQRIVWRETPEEPVQHLRLLTVTYGTSAAPFLATRILKQHAEESREKHPVASQILIEDFYVDDVFTGADSVDEVIALQNELVNLLKSAGFNLRKWTTNCWPLVLILPQDQMEISPIEFEDSNVVKVLGLQWCPSKDSFSYKVTLPESAGCTKRRILSEASKIFDPLGFLSPVIIGIKIFFQDLWRENVNWDDEVSKELSHRWTSIRDELHLVEAISVPRILWTNKHNWELHAFCDASLDAYAAVVYCRSLNVDGTVSISLVAAKSRVAPIKVLSLPRLELCGALLLTRLVNKIKFSLQAEELKIFAWTDSSIVLHWLSSPPKKWSVFIGNRTSEILSSIPLKSLNHVRSGSNPADIATRGISPSLLASTDMWSVVAQYWFQQLASITILH